MSTFSCPISGRSTNLTGMIYVDDCDLIAWFPPSVATQEVVAALQHNVFLWQGGLKATGGSLSLKNARGDSSPTTVKATAGYHITISPLLMSSTF